MLDITLFLVAAICTFFLSVIGGYIVKTYLPLFRAVNAKEPHHQKRSVVPRVGGCIIWAIMTAGTLFLFQITKERIAIIIASTIIVVIGAVDDRRGLRATTQLFWQIIAILIVIVGGIGMDYMTNPFGSFIWLNTIQHTVLLINNTSFHITLFADLITFVWLLLMMNITNWIDGIDGLAPSIGSVAAMVIFALSLKPNIHQPDTALFALLLAATLVGIIVWNKYPATLELGTQGSILIGFYLGVLAILSGSKIATTLLVMGLPLLDAFWVVIKRIVHKRPIWKSDRSHLHHTLLKIGFSHNQIVAIITIIACGFGFIALSVQLREKALSFLLLFLAAGILALAITIKKRKI